MAQVTKLDSPEADFFVGAYTLRETAVLLRATTPPADTNLGLWKRKHDEFIKPTTHHLSQWIRHGMGWEEPFRVSSRDRVITFADLVRLRMIALFRSRGITYRAILQAEDYVRRLRRIPQPFLTAEMWTARSDVFIQFSGNIIAVSRYGQNAFEELMFEFLAPANHGLLFASGGKPVQWRPFPAVLIDPEIQFGAACVEGTRVETRSLWSLNQAGDSMETLAEAFQLRKEQVANAIAWEKWLFEAAKTSAVLSR